MQIGSATQGMLPVSSSRVSRAYGVKPPVPAAPAAASAASQATSSTATTPSITPTSAVAGTVGPRAAATEQLGALVAARVPGRVDFDSASTPQSPGGPYQLYRQSGNRVEVGASIARGQRLDLRG